MLTLKDSATVVRSHYDALNIRDTAKNLSLATDDVKFTNVPFGVDYQGHKGYREHLEIWSTAMPDYKIQIVNLVPGDEWVTVEFIARGTHTGPLVTPEGTFAPTNKKLDMRFCEIVRTREGQISESRLYFDAATMSRQLGLPTPSATPGAPVPTGR